MTIIMGPFSQWAVTYRSFDYPVHHCNGYTVLRKPGNRLWDIYLRESHIGYAPTEDRAKALALAHASYQEGKQQ